MREFFNEHILNLNVVTPFAFHSETTLGEPVKEEIVLLYPFSLVKHTTLNGPSESLLARYMGSNNRLFSLYSVQVCN